MSPNPTASNQSQLLERIREIIAGGGIARMDQRLSRIESGGLRTIESRLATAEAHLESLREQLRGKIADAATACETRDRAQREEIQRLAALVKQSAGQPAESLAEAETRINTHLSATLGQWRVSLQDHLADRDARISARFDQELASLKLWLEEHLAQEAGKNPVTAEHLSRIAAAAQALADTLRPAPLHPNPSSSV